MTKVSPLHGRYQWLDPGSYLYFVVSRNSQVRNNLSLLDKWETGMVRLPTLRTSFWEDQKEHDCHFMTCSECRKRRFGSSLKGERLWRTRKDLNHLNRPSLGGICHILPLQTSKRDRGFNGGVRKNGISWVKQRSVPVLRDLESTPSLQIRTTRLNRTPMSRDGEKTLRHPYGFDSSEFMTTNHKDHLKGFCENSVDGLMGKS